MTAPHTALPKPNAASAVSWSAIQGIGSTLIHFITLAALSRLLEPAVFGVMSILLVIYNIANLFAQMGLSSAIVQRAHLTQQALHSLYWLNVLLGCLVSLCLYLASGLLSHWFNMPALKTTTWVIALTFFISCWSIQYQALAQRELRFRRIALINLSALAGTGVVSIILAMQGAGIWSLVLGILAATIIRTAGFFVFGAREHGLPQVLFNWEEAREMTLFGLNRFGAMFTNAINSNIDQILVGAVFGAQAVGYYNIALRIVMQPIDRINPIVTRVAFPWLSRIQDDAEKINQTYLKILGSLTAVNAPLLVAAGVFAEFYVPLLLGPGWTPAVVLVQILSAYALLRTVINAGGSLVLAKGRADWTFYWNLFLLFLFPAVLYIASRFGDVRFLAYSLLALQFAVVLAYHRLMIYPLTSIGLGTFLAEIGRPILCALTAGAAALAAIMIAQLASSVGNLLLGTIIGAVVYAGLFAVLMPHHLSMLRNMVLRRNARKA